MYTPAIYQLENPDTIRAFLKENAFGILINQTNGKLWATHIPMELDYNSEGKEILHGHLSKENPQGIAFEENTEVLAVFTGPHAYISSSWYDHENVPTWNYTAVHVYGKVKIIHGEAVIDSLTKLVDKYEQASTCPVKVSELSKATMRQAKGVIGFEIEITQIEATQKMSQNRDDHNYKNIIQELEKTQSSSAIAVAEEMKKLRK